MAVIKKIAAPLALAASLVLTSGAAFADEPATAQYPQYWNNGMGYGCGMMGPYWYHGKPAHAHRHHGKQGFGFQERRLMMLGALDLRDAQKPAWKNYASAVDAVHAVNKQKIDPTAPTEQRLQARIERLKARIAAYEDLLKARADFVKVLTPEQLQAFEQAEKKSHQGRFHGKGPQAANK